MIPYSGKFSQVNILQISQFHDMTVTCVVMSVAMGQYIDLLDVISDLAIMDCGKG